jgi:predicted HicB family RNase H-like nuclease
MKKITIRLDDEIYHMAREFSRRKGVSINALVQGMILAENGTCDGSDELGERV